MARRSYLQALPQSARDNRSERFVSEAETPSVNKRAARPGTGGDHRRSNPNNLSNQDRTGDPCPAKSPNAQHSRDIQPLIPENHQEWSVRRRHALLTMAAHHFSWVYQHRVPSLWDKISPEGWQRLTKEYALVFGKETS